MSQQDVRRRYRPSGWDWLVRWAHSYAGQSGLVGMWRAHRLTSQLIPKRDIACPTRYGFDIIVNPSEDPYQKTIFESGSYEPGTLALMSRILRSGDVFLDVGSNIGLMTLTAARLVGASGSVFAFEPHPRVFDRLQENIALSGSDNVHAMKMALGTEPARREIYSYPDVNIGRASLVSSAGGVPSGHAVVATLDSVLEENNVSDVRMMKVDVEGFELEVLKGARNLLSSTSAPILCIEIDHDMPRDVVANGPEEIDQFVMGQNEYHAFRLSKTKFEESQLQRISSINEVPNHDNVIYVPDKNINTIPSDVFTKIINK